MSEIPINLVKRILKERSKGNVSLESVIYVRDLIQDILDKLADASIIEFEELNRYRQIQKLPKLKRYPVSVFINLSDELFKPTVVNKSEEIGEMNNNTIFSTEAGIEVV